MTNRQKIAIDVMGGDFGPKIVIPAANIALQKHESSLEFVLVGDEGEINTHLNNYPELKKVSKIIHTDQVIANDEKPSTALRSGKKSSMRLAIDAVKNGDAESIVSAGNTGALMATAKLVLKCLPGINRPAIASVMPTQTGETIMLDLGANLTCDAEILVQFAILGSVYARAIKNIDNPTVGLLNIGSEQMKGHEQLRTAANILNNVKFPGNFVGFVEGNDIPMGTVDVVVTDGFTGNVALKVAEGVGMLTKGFVKEALKSSLLARIGGMLAYSSMKKVNAKMDPRLYNGGMFLGLNGICVKSHGGMDEYGFSQAIKVAAKLVKNGYNDRVAYEIEQVMNQESFFSSLSHGHLMES